MSTLSSDGAKERAALALTKQFASSSPPSTSIALTQLHGDSFELNSILGLTIPSCGASYMTPGCFGSFQLNESTGSDLGRTRSLHAGAVSPSHLQVDEEDNLNHIDDEREALAMRMSYFICNIL